MYYNGEHIDQIFVSTNQFNPNSSECGYRDDNYSETEALVFSNTNTDVANTMLAKIWMET